MPLIDPSVFSPNSVSAETEEINNSIIDKLSGQPNQWSISVAESRALRARGEGAFPLPPKSPRAIDEQIDGPHGKIDIRIIAPENPTGVYLHFHGGGWVLGTADQQDARMEGIVENCGMATVSVDYRLAPENPYPAGPDDCEAAALWLIENAKARFGTERLLIGGESSGAHLSAVTLLRLRDKHKNTSAFCGANLVCGYFDAGKTPSAHRWGDEKLILNSEDLDMFTKMFVPEQYSLTDPDISPLYAELSDMPPAIFTVGTRDPLLDDSIFMANRWAQAGNVSDLGVYPGGAHVFVGLGGELAAQGNQNIYAFLKGC